jgi:ElaB/YqjD/DUF883 family membrane-anchored ribosome-binding protein
MDDFNTNNPSGQTSHEQSESGTGTAARMKISEKAADVKEKVADFGRRAVDSIDDSRKTAAGALDRTASTLHSSGDQLSDAAHTAANKLQATADYVRQTDLKGMAADVQDVVKRYPGPSLAVAAVLGFLVARGFRSNS